MIAYVSFNYLFVAFFPKKPYIFFVSFWSFVKKKDIKVGYKHIWSFIPWLDTFWARCFVTLNMSTWPFREWVIRKWPLTAFMWILAPCHFYFSTKIWSIIFFHVMFLSWQLTTFFHQYKSTLHLHKPLFQTKVVHSKTQTSTNHDELPNNMLTNNNCFQYALINFFRITNDAYFPESTY